MSWSNLGLEISLLPTTKDNLSTVNVATSWSGEPKTCFKQAMVCLKLQRTVIAVRRIRETCGCWWSVPKDLPLNVGFSRLITATFSRTLWISTLRATSAAKTDPLPPSARRPRSFSKQRPRIDVEQGRTYQENWSQSMRLSWRTNHDESTSKTEEFLALPSRWQHTWQQATETANADVSTCWWRK